MRTWSKTYDQIVIYREKANGRLEYWTYTEGGRKYVSRAWADDQVCRGYAVYTDV